MSNEPGLVPELTVTDYEASRRFWCDLVGFFLPYERPAGGRQAEPIGPGTFKGSRPNLF